MAELLQHKHCKNCGRAITADQDLCDRDECSSAWAALTKRRARMQLLFYAAASVFFLSLLWAFLQPYLNR